MNALFSAIKDKQKIIFANEGRLFKKSFFGLLILILAFQTGNFGNVIVFPFSLFKIVAIIPLVTSLFNIF